MKKLLTLFVASFCATSFAQTPADSTNLMMFGGESWSLYGNEFDDSDIFLGTINPKALVIKTNDIERFRITDDGRVLFPGIEGKRLVYLDEGGALSFLDAELGHELLYPSSLPLCESNTGGPGIWYSGLEKLVSCQRVGIRREFPRSALDVEGLTITNQLAVNTDYVPNGYSMSVNGKIIAEEIEVKLRNTWPDYVFEKGYQLISLEQVKKQIEAEKHLPGMPSAKEVEENGLAIGEMQRMMMEKIEELFLHTIKLNEELSELKKANEELKSQIGK